MSANVQKSVWPSPYAVLTFVLLLAAPGCPASPQSASWGSAWGSSSSPEHPVRARRQLNFRNEWATWSGWSVCSRSCGGGASVRTRTCLTRNPVGGPCAGDPRQYKICNTKECSAGSEGFREMQCAAFNDRPLVAGNSFRWTTFHGGSNPCELSCLALGHNFYYNFGHVLDGTSCSKEPGAVCVNGRCLKPGCDSILGSKQQEDACMVCGGHNTTCLHHKSVYQNRRMEAGGPFGYNEVAMIPAGATHIRVTDNSRNYLALQNGRSQFVINGNWKISVPGEYSVAGTKLLYRRSADTWESFEVPGPTQEDLHLMVLATERNSGIEYEYWLPPDQYALYHGRRSPLRQAHHTSSYLPRIQPTTSTTTTTTIRSPPNTTRSHWFLDLLKTPRQSLQHNHHQRPRQPITRLEREENHRNLLPQAPPGRHCGKCLRVKGRRERQRQYCQKDFVFRAKVLGKLYRGEETRYDVQIIHTYRNRYRLEHREFLWVQNVCDCPKLEEGKQYILMVRRHINYEHTLNRILMEEESYVVPYRPREDELLRPLERLCSNRGTKEPAELGV
nr:ADAMTS-like protein 5 isoform X1 [Nothobranchius furzeri]XP_054588511.1 ADAMTS-like protein 5 isoform X1 [Nothobranchius furzeri]XP_054588513.1 ADAMTS-like protein 5 isoform X1 [Nothobranchius furzeri]XP_054588514.1 ADAMTS-like protein 5 isoform X1 [Nothobranchius furzeri]XP_054588515.1 ADAMTS-like protein 5 isoform X1 [Nothobranchius furzeri]